MRRNNYVLTPGRYVEFKAAEDEAHVFEEQMQELTATLQQQLHQAAELDRRIAASLQSIGYNLQPHDHSGINHETERLPA